MLREFGLPPGSAPALRTIRLVAQGCRWEHGEEPCFTLELEPCINGPVVTVDACFGQEVGEVVQRLLREVSA